MILEDFSLNHLKDVASKANEVINRHNSELAKLLTMSGIVLIPCDELRNNQFIVSRAIYEAAKKLAVPE